jgi:hypothetical protein
MSSDERRCVAFLQTSRVRTLFSLPLKCGYTPSASRGTLGGRLRRPDDICKIDLAHERLTVVTEDLDGQMRLCGKHDDFTREARVGRGIRRYQGNGVGVLAIHHAGRRIGQLAGLILGVREDCTEAKLVDG